MKLISKYLDGKPIKPNDFMSVNDFITSKIDSTRNAAYNKSLTRTMPAKVGKVRNPMTEELYNANKKKAEEDLRKNPNSLIAQCRVNIFSSPYNPFVDGFSCLATATDNYGKPYKVTGNLTFRANPGKYGFKEIPQDSLRLGDLVQNVNEYNIPSHALIYAGKDSNGKPIYNYSAGGFDASDIKILKHYPLNKSYNYTFVGTPQDSARWTNEYVKNLNLSNMDYAEINL